MFQFEEQIQWITLVRGHLDHGEIRPRFGGSEDPADT